MYIQTTSMLAALMVTFSSFAWAEETPPTAPKKAEIVTTAEQKAKAAELAKSYPLTTCVVSHDEVGGSNDTVDALYDGRLIRFCCKGCVKSFNKKPEKYLKELDAAAKPSA
jgi:YHS domain-containing protein